MSREISSSNQPPEDSALTFVNAEDDTPENREILRIIQERSNAGGMPLDLDAVIRDLGHDPADFALRD